MPLALQSVDHVHEYAAKLRGSAGITGIPASLYRAYVVRQARGALQTELHPEDAQFLQDVCKGVDGLGPDMDARERVFIGHETLYRLSCFPPPTEPKTSPASEPVFDDVCGRPDDGAVTDTIGTPIAANYEEPPAPKPKRKRKTKA